MDDTAEEVLEYVCLLCGAQGSLRIKDGFQAECPKCGAAVLHIQRETVSLSLEHTEIR